MTLHVDSNRFGLSESMREEVGGHVDKILKMAKDAGAACEAFIEESYQPDKSIVELAEAVCKKGLAISPHVAFHPLALLADMRRR